MAILDTKSGSHREELAELHVALQAAATEVRASLRRTAILRAAWQWLALLGTAFILDLAFGLPVSIRWVVLLGLVAFAVICVYRIIREQRAFSRSDEWAARAVEERFPDIDNALINGVQFERILADGTTDEDVSQLMRLEIERARKTSRRIDEAGGAFDRSPEIRAVRGLAIAAIVWLLVIVLSPSGFIAVIPRLLAPWQDDITPPWSATKFDVQPQGASVRYGDSLEIDVKLSGQMPGDTALMIRARGQSEWQRLEMSGDEPGSLSSTLEDLSQDTQYYVQSNTGRSARYWITVVKPPQATGTQAIYLPPKYTGRPAFSETVGQGGIHGLQGTEVTLLVSSNRDLTAGILHIAPDDDISGSGYQVKMAPVKGTPDEVSGKFVIDRPGVFKVGLEAVDGQTSLGAAQGKIVVDTNGRPNVWISQPGRDLLVTPTMVVPLQIEAQDENALAAVTLHRIINDLDDDPIVYPVTGVSTSQTESSTFNFPDLGVQPGDVIKYYAEAADNQPGLPNVGVSQTYTVTVVTPEQFQKALAQARTPSKMHTESMDMIAAANRMASEQQQLAKEIAQTAAQLAKKPGDAALQKQMKDLAAQQKELQQAAKKLSDQMKQYAQSPSASDFERAIKKQVAEAAAKIAAAAKLMGDASNSTNPAQQAAAGQKAAQLTSQACAQLQQRVQRPVEQLVKMYALYRDVQRFFQLLTAQGELVLRARQFEDHGAATASQRADISDLANQQDQIEQALVQLQADFRFHADQAQDIFPKAAASARRIASEIDQRRIPPLMSSARDAFRRNDGPTGFQRANEALTQMSAMVQHCQSAQNGQKSDLSDSLSLSLGEKGLGNSLDQIGGPGTGNGDGEGMGIGIGGVDEGPDGSPGGSAYESGQNSPQPYTPPTDFMNGTGGPDKLSHPNTIPGSGAPLSPADVEVTAPHAGAPPKPGDQNTTSFPATYRKLISDYYRSVANGQ